jgi:plastocyanin
MRELGKQLGLLLIVVVVIAVILTIFGAWPSQQENSIQGPSTTTLPAPTPPSAAVLQQLANSPAFQYLVSYTGNGFMPNSLSVKKGQVVRFTNNSSTDLWIASIGTDSNDIYPGTSSCGGSTFDSCQSIGPGGFWEFTFDQSGTWSFQNNLDKTKTGTITIIVQ